MAKIETSGAHMVTVQSAEFGESAKGTPFLMIYFVDADNNGIGSWNYLSEKALPNTVKTLRDAFGFDGNFETCVDQILNKQASITCEFEADDKGNDKLKVKWINSPRRSAPINDQASFLKSLSAKAARIPAAAPKAGAAPVKAAAPVRQAARTAPKAVAADSEFPDAENPY